MLSLQFLSFAAGFGGALIRNVVKNNSLVMPKLLNGNLVLGFIGCGLTGGAVGLATGGNPATAFFAGYTGMSLISKVMPQEVLKQDTILETMEQVITRVCKEEGVDPALAIKVARCESSLNPNATNRNTNGSTDRGLFQINDQAHPEVPQDMAFDAEYSAHFFCQAFKAGHLSWWNASKKCWAV